MRAETFRFEIRPAAALAGAVMLMAALGARPSLAQPAGRNAATPADSLGRPIFGFLRPTYKTDYSVTQQQSTWSQGFAFQNTFGAFNLSSDTQYVVRTDPNRANYKNAVGTTNNNLRHRLANRIDLTGNLNYSRDGVDDTNDQTRREWIDGGLTGNYRWRVRRGLDVTLTGGASLSKRKDSAVFQEAETGVRESGFNRDVGLQASYIGPVPGMSFRLDTSRAASSTRSISVTAEEGTPADDPKRNTKTGHVLNWNYIPFDGLEATARYERRSLLDNYVLVSRDTTVNGRQEVQENASEAMGMTLRLKPPESATTELIFDISQNENISSREVEEERSSDRTGRAGSVKLRHMLVGTQTETNFKLNRDTDGSPIRPGSKTVTRALDTSFSRSLSTDLTGRLIGEIYLRTQSYEDGLLDQDNQKLRGEGSFTWKPTAKLVGTLGGRVSRDNTVLIDSTQSRGSRLEENYSFTVDIKYSLTPRTRFAQLYDFKALFTSFIFNPGGDNIQRTRDIRTVLSHQLLAKLGVELNHAFRYRETGGYRRQSDGGRVFAKSNDRYDQDLRLSLNYAPKPWLTFRTEEWFHRDDDIKLVDDSRRTNGRIEFSQSASLNRPIPGGGTLTFAGSYRVRRITKPTLGAREEYLDMTVSLTKPF